MTEPYQAILETEERADTMTRILQLRLEPLMTEYRFPLWETRTKADTMQAKIDIVRSMVRSMMKLAIDEFIKQLSGRGDVPENFDYDAFTGDDLRKLTKELAEVRKRAEWLQRVRLQYQGFMEANGKNWQAIEKLGG